MNFNFKNFNDNEQTNTIINTINKITIIIIIEQYCIIDVYNYISLVKKISMYYLIRKFI